MTSLDKFAHFNEHTNKQEMVQNETSRANNNSNNNTSVSDFNTYEEYLDSQITPLDMYYLEVLGDNSMSLNNF